jgi:hypothetical protein
VPDDVRGKLVKVPALPDGVPRPEPQAKKPDAAGAAK